MSMVLFVSYELSIDNVSLGKGWTNLDVNYSHNIYVANDFTLIFNEAIKSARCKAYNDLPETVKTKLKIRNEGDLVITIINASVLYSDKQDN